MDDQQFDKIKETMSAATMLLYSMDASIRNGELEYEETKAGYMIAQAATEAVANMMDDSDDGFSIMDVYCGMKVATMWIMCGLMDDLTEDKIAVIENKYEADKDMEDSKMAAWVMMKGIVDKIDEAGGFNED